METKTQRILALCNILLVTIILLDYLLPGRIMPIQELDSFYSTTVKISRGMRPSYVDRSVVSLTSGKTFRLGKIPDGNYTKGQKIQIVKSAFTNNIKEIIIIKNIAETKYVGILSNIFFLIPLILSVLISFLNIFYKSKMLHIFFVASTMFTFIFAIGYLLS